MLSRKERMRKEASRITRIAIYITTYNRPFLLEKLLRDIDNNSKEYLVDVYIYDDCSSKDYSDVIEFVKSKKWNFFESKKNCGKEKFYVIFNKMFRHAKKDFDGFNRSPSIPSPKYYFFLQDDISLVENFFDKSISIWNSLPPENLCSLSLMVDKNRVNSTCWTGVYPYCVGQAHDTGWVDCIFMCKSLMLKKLNWEIESIPKSRWRKNTNLSSGVGQQISKRLFENSLKMYRSKDNLIFHNGDESMMNPNRKYLIKGHVWGSKNKREKIVACMAAIPSRVSGLPSVVNSLIDQVDELKIYLNEYKTVPNFLKSEKITVFRSQDYRDLGDSGKFFFLKDYSGYYFSCDDDIIYPKDYISNTIKNIDFFNRKAFVGYHGIIVNHKFKSYFASRKVYHYRRTVEYSRPVNILGTGVMAFHTDTIHPKLSDFKKKNMADIWMAIFAKNNKVPMICLRHSKKYFRLTENSEVLSIYNSSKDGDKSKKDTLDYQNRQIALNMPWKVLYV